MIETKVSATGENWLLLEPKDLRIGNALLYKDKFVHVTMLSLDIDDEYQDTIGFCEWGKNTDEHSDWNRAMPELKPIPLTPEILEKCGFYKSKTEWIKRTEEDPFIIEFFEFTKAFHYTGGEGVRLGIGGKYLHQLQNLYFALTGDELTIKL